MMPKKSDYGVALAEEVRTHRGQRVSIRPSAGQTPESVEQDFASSFALGERLLADGTQEWRSHQRRWGRLKVMAYKEVGPPPWRWPRIGILSNGWRFVRFIVGWRSTAYALCVLWGRS